MPFGSSLFTEPEKNIKLWPSESFLDVHLQFPQNKHYVLLTLLKIQTGKNETTSACVKIQISLLPSFKTGPDLSVARTDRPLRLRAAGAEATDGFPAGEPG